MVMQGRALGGGTSHNTGLCFPVSEAVWDGWRALGAVDESYASFREVSEVVLAKLRARPALESEVNRNNALLRKGADALGLSHVLARHNRLECSGCGFCTLGCAYDRKISVVHAFLPEACEAGLRIRTGFRVTKIERRARGYAVCGRDAEGERRIEAEDLVLAAGATGTPILLQRSGLGSSRSIGRHLHIHPFAPVGALFNEEVCAHRGVPQSVIVDGDADYLRGERGGYLLMAAAAQPGVTALMTPGQGELHRSLMRNYRRLAAGGVLLHDHSAGRVRARRDGKPLIRYWPDKRDAAELKRGIKRLAELYFAAGAESVVLPFEDHPLLNSRDEIGCIDRLPVLKHRITLGSVHPQGSCRLASSARAGVCRPDGRVFGEEHLWVADASLFPSSLGAPPQVTTMALAWRVSEQLLAERGH